MVKARVLDNGRELTNDDDEARVLAKAAAAAGRRAAVGRLLDRAAAAQARIKERERGVGDMAAGEKVEKEAVMVEGSTVPDCVRIGLRSGLRSFFAAGRRTSYGRRRGRGPLRYAPPRLAPTDRPKAPAHTLRTSSSSIRPPPFRTHTNSRLGDQYSVL